MRFVDAFAAAGLDYDLLRDWAEDARLRGRLRRDESGCVLTDGALLLSASSHGWLRHLAHGARVEPRCAEVEDKAFPGLSVPVEVGAAYRWTDPWGTEQMVVPVAVGIGGIETPRAQMIFAEPMMRLILTGTDVTATPAPMARRNTAPRAYPGYYALVGGDGERLRWLLMPLHTGTRYPESEAVAR